MKSLVLILIAMLDIVPVGDAFLTPLQKRDSILVADQLEYGFELEGLEPGMVLQLPDFSKLSNDTLTVVRNWEFDTLSTKKSKTLKLRGSVVLAPFEEGEYSLPDIYVLKGKGEQFDTLKFAAAKMDVKTMPVDTSNFEIRDIKGQIKYPVTVAEVLPWVGLAILVAGLVALGIWLYKRSRKAAAERLRQDPPHIVALRELDKYRSDKFWAPEKQKVFYSGITDALKVYIDARFGVDAPEMTTAELFAALKKDSDITPDLYLELKELFERADFVKFAKFISSDEDNAKVLPCAVRFVTSTYQSEIEEESGEEAAGQ